MRILISPGPYKECISAFEVADAIKRGVEAVIPRANVTLRPLSDGGSGIAVILSQATGGTVEKVKVRGPLGNYVLGQVGYSADRSTAIIESASAAGLSLIPMTKRNPTLTSTYGVGQLIAHAAHNGAEKIIVGCGDSGTNDCGIGCASALGVDFYEKGKSSPREFPAGRDLEHLTRIDASGKLKQLESKELIVACNLTSVLLGPDGTSRIYAPQKGASEIQVELLERGVKNFVDLVRGISGDDVSYVPGAGGAGGLAASLYAFFGAKLSYSIDVVDRFIGLDRYLADTDLVLTGEGRIDDRTATGKVACGLALKAKKYNLPVIAIVGSIAEDHEDIFYNGIDAVESISDGPISVETSMRDASRLISAATTRVMRFVQLGSIANSNRKIAGRTYLKNAHPKAIPTGRSDNNVPFLRAREKKATRIRGWIFDLGNTLMSIPTEYDEELALRAVLGLETEDQVRSIIYNVCQKYRGQSEEDFLKSLDAQMNPNHDVALTKGIRRAWVDSTDHAELKPGAREVLHSLRQRGMKIALVSNTPPTSHAILRRLHLKDYFDSIVFSCDVGYLKPDPRIFRIALSRLGMDSSEVVLVGDKIRTDILGGRIIGLRSILIEERLREIIENDRHMVDAIVPGVYYLPETKLYKSLPK